MAAEAKTSTAAPRVADRLGEPRHILTPAVCLPCYRQHRGAVIDGVRTLTMQNHVFRYEGTSFRPLQRGWDFTVRDIVFFGTDEELSRLREAVMDRAIALCQELGLQATIELANDPFFLDTSRDKAVYQRMGEVKYELLFPLPTASRSPRRRSTCTATSTRRSTARAARAASSRRARAWASASSAGCTGISTQKGYAETG